MGNSMRSKGIARAMTAGTLKEEGALGYEWYLSGDRKDCHLIENYKDASAVQAHLDSAVVRELVPQMLAVSSIDSFPCIWRPWAEGSRSAEGDRG
jgi:quinol monooxygenase YgiN